MVANLPLAGLALVVCVSVGYGFGTLAQFDHDWRSTAPVLVVSMDGAIRAGEPLDDAVAELLAGSATPVRDVQCGLAVPDQAADSEALCRARGTDGMVAILASPSAGALHVDVFAAP
jgi:hypothetical protein